MGVYQNMIANAVSERFNLFRGAWLKPKHDHYHDFGWPKDLSFKDFRSMYERNGLAAAAVDRTVGKTWENFPQLWEKETAAESQIEKDLRKRFEKIRLWQKLATADTRSLVGKYAGVILLLRDELPFDQPVGRLSSIDDLVDVIPVWEDQLVASSIDRDTASENYGQVLFYEFEEAAVDGKATSRKIKVHHQRVLIWSEDGTLNGDSLLKPGFNDLIDVEKIKGAGGEGFWKTARGAPIIEAPKDVKMTDVAKGLGVTPEALKEKIDKNWDDFQSGFNKAIMLGGMTATPLTISLPSPEHFMAGPVNVFAASIRMPVKILLGSQSGERASTEDSNEWNKTCNSRRVNVCKPLILRLVEMLVEYGALAELDWHVGWDDLTESSSEEKLKRAKDMSEINAKDKTNPVFLGEEIREAAGFKPFTQDQLDTLGEMDPPPLDDDEGEDDLPPGSETQEE